MIFGHNGGNLPPGVGLNKDYESVNLRWSGPVGTRFQLRELQRDDALVKSIQTALAKDGVVRIVSCGYFYGGKERYPREQWEEQLQQIANLLDRSVCALRVPSTINADGLPVPFRGPGYQDADIIDWVYKVPNKR
jgi:hypothetical protein